MIYLDILGLPLPRLVIWNGLLGLHYLLAPTGSIGPAPYIASVIITRLLLISWLQSDSRTTRYWPCFEYEAFTFMAWPFTLPQYLVHTRGRKGVLVFLGFLGLMWLPFVCASFREAITLMSSE